MGNKHQFSILVNTTDSFEDCWIPFFTLFKKYWPDYKGTIYLNTETKRVSFQGLNIVSIQNNLANSNYVPTWSECLLHALDVIPDVTVLYMQEDYFLHDFVKNDIIIELSSLISSTDIDCIHITDQATPGPFYKTDYSQLVEIGKKAPYRISTQAALWRKDVLRKYIRKNENAWQFEYYASKRAGIFKDKLYNVTSILCKKDQNEIIPYVFTGIIRGKWNKEVIELFSKNGIIVDYEKRGYYDTINTKKVLDRLKTRLSVRAIKTNLVSKSDIFVLKMKSIFD